MSSTRLGPRWARSTYSQKINDDCVEARLDGGVKLRDSKNPSAGTLEIPAEGWSAFLAAIQ